MRLESRQFQRAFLQAFVCFQVKRLNMRIQVQTLGSGSVDFDIQETDTVAHVKKLLEEKEGISPEQLRLVAKGKVLRDNETLTAGTSIKVILVVRGGACGGHS